MQSSKAASQSPLQIPTSAAVFQHGGGADDGGDATATGAAGAGGGGDATATVEGVHSRPLEGMRLDPQVPTASGSQSLPRYDLVKVRARGRIGASGLC